MKHALQKDRWLKELAILATLAGFACTPLHALQPAGASDTGGETESELTLSSSSSDEEEQEADAPLQLTPVDDPLKSATADDAAVGTAVRDEEEAEERQPTVSTRRTGRSSEDAPAKTDRAKSKPAQADNVLRPAKGATESAPSSQGRDELSLEEQQAKDQGECPGGEEAAPTANRTLNDLPLEQEEHPFDAPAAEPEEHKLDPVEAKSPAGRPGATPLAPIENAAQQVLHQRINTCLAYYFTNQENLAKRSPWAVMHTILPFGVETDIVAGNRHVNAIGWMCYNGVCKTQRMFHPTHSGFRTNVGPGVQGHEGQFLAILAQSGVPRNFPIIVGKTRYTVSDLIRYEMATCREKSELTFKLIGLSHYLAPRQVWRDERGQVWNLEKLVREEIEQPVVGAACGGTHRLMGLSYALMMRRRYGEPINGHWARADVYVKDFVSYAWTLQNPDGSFSTDWFEGRANEPSMERKVQTTGHILEWLVFTLPPEQLNDPRVTKAVEFILSQVYDNRDHDWPIGPRGHALRALALYNQRVFKVPAGQLKSHLAQTGLVKGLR